MRRCEHGIYLPEGQEKSWGCQDCYPEGHDDAGEPILMQRSPLRARENSPVPVCPDCGITATRSSNECIKCGNPLTGAPAGYRMRANRREPGECPACSSRVHLETADRKIWQCADCEVLFDAPSKSK